MLPDATEEIPMFKNVYMIKNFIWLPVQSAALF